MLPCPNISRRPVAPPGLYPMQDSNLRNLGPKPSLLNRTPAMRCFCKLARRDLHPRRPLALDLKSSLVDCLSTHHCADADKGSWTLACFKHHPLAGEALNHSDSCRHNYNNTFWQNILDVNIFPSAYINFRSFKLKLEANPQASQGYSMPEATSLWIMNECPQSLHVTLCCVFIVK